MRHFLGYTTHPKDRSTGATALYGWERKKIIRKAAGRPLRVGGEYCMVVPAWKTPRRLAGLHIASIQDGKIESDYLPVDPDNPEGGLVGLNSVHEFDPIGNCVVAINNPWLAIRINNIQHRYTGASAPIVAWAWTDSAKTVTAWQHLKHFNVVIWTGKVVTWDALAFAAMNDWKLAIGGPSSDDYREQSIYAAAHEPQMWLGRAVGVARHWKTRFYHWMYQNRAKVTELASRMMSAGVDPELITPHLFGKTQTDWRKAVAQVHAANKAKHCRVPGTTTVYIENSTGWYAYNLRDPKDVATISNCVVRITHLFARGETPWYRGEVRTKGKAYPFEGKVAEMEPDLWLWLRKFVAMHNLQLHLSPYYKPRLFDIVNLMCKIETVTEADLKPFDPTPYQFRRVQIESARSREALASFAAATISVPDDPLAYPFQASDPVRSQEIQLSPEKPRSSGAKEDAYSSVLTGEERGS